MSQQQQQQQYRDPPPYPGHSKQVYSNQPGLRQSFSGSETSTDVSLSSTENLASWQRQEPQGEETQTPLYQHLDDGSYSILARLGMPPGTVEPKGLSEQITSSSSSSFFSSASHQAYYSHPAHSQSVYAASTTPGGREAYVGGGGHLGLTVPHAWQMHGLPPPQSGHYSRSLTPTYHHPHPYINTWTNPEGGSAGHPVPTSQFLSHPPHLPPPPQYPGNKGSESERKDIRRSYETIASKTELRHSHPDLTTDPSLARSQSKGDGLPAHLGGHTNSEPIFSITGSGSSTGSHDRTEHVVSLLTEENQRLREELNSCYKKVSKLQKFELEIEKVHEAYESLVKSSQKREKLEAALKSKLEEEVRKLRQQNEDLRAELSADEPRSSRQDSLDSNKSQREILDAKLAATQSSLSRLEEEVRKKDAQVGRVEQLQKAFTSLQTTSQRREEKEKQLRSRLERELEAYKSREQGAPSGSTTPKDETRSMAALKQMLNDKETKILQLETEIIRWEQRYVEMQAVQQMGETTAPQEAHLAALEKSSAETEKLIDEAKTEKLRHMEELYQSNRRVAELEAKVKWLQTQLQEKEAMVKVYQRAPTLPRSSSVHAICCSPLHSPRPSLIATTAYTRPSGGATCSATTGSYCDFVTIKHVKTGSTSAIETGRKMSLDDNLCDQRHDYSVSKSDTEDETRLWQV